MPARRSFASGNALVVRDGVLPGAVGAHVAARCTFERRVMGKSLSIRLLHTFLVVVFSVAATASFSTRAATLYGAGYARVGVPDLAQAEAFFQDVLDCRVIGPNAPSVATGAKKPATTRLLSCDAGSVVELFDNHGVSPSPTPVEADQPLRFVSDDVLHGSEWLQREGATVNGAPRRLTSGPLAGRMVLDFMSPWGMPLQLLDSHADTPDGTLATVAAD